jgi:hypothetical protein
MSDACCLPDTPAEAKAKTTNPTAFSRADVAALAHLATSLDYLKNRFPDPVWRSVLKKAVCAMHGVALEIDGEHSFGIYAQEDGQ